MVTSADIENLVEEVLWLLTDETEPVSEHDLLAQLTHEEAFQKLDTGSAIRKQAQKHFLMMHVLYKLRERLEDSRFRLHMRPDAIRLIDLDAPPTTGGAESEQMPAAEGDDGDLRDYYLDVTQLPLGDDSSSSLDEHKEHFSNVQRRYLNAAVQANEFY